MINIKVRDKQYTLRFDMSVMEYLEEKGSNIGKQMTEMKSSKEARPVIEDLFCCMANAANDYLNIPERYSQADIALFTKHSTIGWMKVVQKAISEAVKDGSRMETAEEEDRNCRDLYLKEIEKEEAAKN